MQENYQAFRNHPFISSIADIKKWTVSTKDKMPIDMHTLIEKHRIAGAVFNNEQSLVSLDLLNQTLPDAANYAFYLDVLNDKFAILDIEPKCPDEEKQKLSKLPAIYRETSMSGKGIHLVFPVPEWLLDKEPMARQKVVFKEEHGWYEILLNHYVTFTGNQIPAPNDASSDPNDFYEFFSNMASEQKITVKGETNVEEIEFVDTFYSAQILQKLMEHRKDYRKTLADFNNDYSKYEFAYIAYTYRQLTGLLNVDVIKQDHSYTDSEKAWFLYQVASSYLPHRAKHEELRSGLPWLLYLSREVIATNNAQSTDTKKKKDKKKGDKK